MLDTFLLWMNLGECVCVGDGEAIGEGGVKEKVKLGLKKPPHIDSVKLANDFTISFICCGLFLFFYSKPLART